MTTETRAASGSVRTSRPVGESSLWVALGVGVAFVLGLFLFLRFATGARLDSATVGLVVAAGTLALCLRAMFNMARVLAHPDLRLELDHESALGVEGQRELREERRRLLRAIQELQFDFQMGKLSESDYREVRQSYELKAVEVMRALDSDASLHPKLAAELKARGILGQDLDVAPREPALDSDARDRGEDDSTSVAEASGDRASESVDSHSDRYVEERMAQVSVDEESDRESSVASPAERSLADEADHREAKAAVTERSPADVEAPVCGPCGVRNDLDAKFCKRCGAQLT